jgi:Sec-independent protein translocase protein TatA
MPSIGLGEIALAIAVVFLVAPRKLPGAMKVIGRIIGVTERVRRDLCDVDRNVRDIAVGIAEKRHDAEDPDRCD